MGQPDIRPEYSQERLEEALRLDAAANVRFARELAVVSSRVFGVDLPCRQPTTVGEATDPSTVDPGDPGTR